MLLQYNHVDVEYVAYMIGWSNISVCPRHPECLQKCALKTMLACPKVLGTTHKLGMVLGRK